MNSSAAKRTRHWLESIGSQNRKSLKRLYALSDSIRYDPGSGTGLLPHAKVEEPDLDDVGEFVASGHKRAGNLQRAWFDE